VRVTRTVVRPGRRNGGTTLVFRLRRPALLRIKIVRVYPTCSVIGSFTVRARAGVNRIRFRGRLRGRPLRAGGYRLIVRARGASRDAAVLPIVVARGRTTPKAVRKAKSTIVCSEPVADFDASDAATGAVTSNDTASGGGLLGTIKERVKAPVAAVAGAVARTARGLTERVKNPSDDPLQNPLLLTLVGVVALISAILGGMALIELARTRRYRSF
jgi:hypothetical protein